MIADGKRGDIGSTARAYAAAYLEGDAPRADALTVNPWLGRESVEPYLAAARRYGAGIFCIVKTSNAGGDVQDVDALGRPAGVAARRRARRRVGRRSRRRARALGGRRRRRRDASACGQRGAEADAAGDPAAARASARRARRPGDLARAFTSGPASALVNASRSVNYAFRESGERLPRGRRRRGGAAQARDLGRLGLVACPAAAGARYAGAGRVPARGDDRGRRSSAAGFESGGGADAARGAPPHGDDAPPSPTALLDVVRAGDTFEAIAAKTGMSTVATSSG